MSSALSLSQHHGKSKVRLGRTWREGNTHHFKEWSVNTMLDSDMEHAYVQGSNAGMVSTHTQHNMVYIIAQRMSQRCTVEEYAVALAKQFVQTYPLVSKSKIYVEEKPWTRVQVNGAPHDHGYALTGTERRTVYVTYDKAGNLEVTAGVKDVSVLKTTQSGFEGFLRDQFTVLPECKERIMATSILATWRYSSQPPCYEAAFVAAKAGLMEAFYGPAKGGVYSPSVQYTLYRMAQALLDRVPQAESVFLNMPNLHFLPCAPLGSTFKDDVYIATSEPHGNIEATITRKGSKPHCRL